MVPAGEIVPPVDEDDVIVKVLAAKVAVALLAASIVTWHVVAVPEHAPDQPVNVELVSAAALRVTTVPAAKLVPVGFVVMVPVPVPEVVVVNAYEVIPLWVIVNKLPAIVDTVVLSAPVLGVTVYDTVAVLVAVVPDVIVTQLSLLIAVQLQPVCVVTVTVPLPPAVPKEALEGESV